MRTEDKKETNENKSGLTENITEITEETEIIQLKVYLCEEAKLEKADKQINRKSQKSIHSKKVHG